LILLHRNEATAVLDRRADADKFGGDNPFFNGSAAVSLRVQESASHKPTLIPGPTQVM